MVEAQRPPTANEDLLSLNIFEFIRLANLAESSKTESLAPSSVLHAWHSYGRSLLGGLGFLMSCVAYPQLVPRIYINGVDVMPIPCMLSIEIIEARAEAAVFGPPRTGYKEVLVCRSALSF